MWLSVVRRTVGSFSWLNGETVIRKGTMNIQKLSGVGHPRVSKELQVHTPTLCRVNARPRALNPHTG